MKIRTRMVLGYGVMILGIAAMLAITAASDTARMGWAICAIGGMTMLAGLVGMRQNYQYIDRPLRDAIDMADCIAVGDLSAPIFASAHGEFGVLQGALQSTSERIRCGDGAWRAQGQRIRPCDA